MNEETKYFSIPFNTDEKVITSNLSIEGDSIKIRQIEKYAVDSVVQLKEYGSIIKIEDFFVSNNNFIYILDERKCLWEFDYYNNDKRIIFRYENLNQEDSIKIAVCDGNFVAFVGEKVQILSLNTAELIFDLKEINQTELYAVAVTSDKKENFYLINFLGLANDSTQGELQLIKINASTGETEILNNMDIKFNEKFNKRLLKSVIQMEVSKQGDIFIINSITKEVYKISQGIVSNFSLTAEIAFPAGLGINSKEELFFSDTGSFDESIEYNEFIFRTSKEGMLKEKIPTLRGKIEKIQVDKKDNLLALSKSSDSITIFKLKPQYYKRQSDNLIKGTIIAPALDSGTSETVWHRLLMEVDIPKDTQVEVSYFALENKEVKYQNEKIDMDEFIEDNNISFEEKMLFLDNFWSKPYANTKDTLIFQAEGRYFWFKLELLGSKENSPSIKKMRIYYPRNTYLRYLPAIYQKDKNSKAFLEEFLSIFESIMMNMEEKIDNISQYFEPDYATGEYLKWLLGWMKITPNECWEEKNLRELLKRSSDLYKKRGTRQGIQEIIEIFSGYKPYIIEYSQLKDSLNNPELSSLLNTLYKINPYAFCVLIPAAAVKSKKHQEEIEKLINNEKPAYTEARLVLLQPMVSLDLHCYLGVNSYLSKAVKMNLDNNTSIANGIILMDSLSEKAEIHSKLK